MNRADLLDIMFSGRERHIDSSKRAAATGPECNLAAQEGSSPTAGVRTADASVPVVRYWTVKIEARGRIRYDHVEACDPFKANLVAFKRNSAAISAQVVREIDREEFEHLTRVPA